MQNQLESRVYAGFFVRFAAFMIDSLIAAIIVGMIKFPFSVAAQSGAAFLSADLIFHYSLLDVFGYVGVAAYFILLTYFSHSTPGKMLFHLEVVTQNGEWTFVNILYRETVGRFLSSLLCIGYLAVLVQRQRQGFHDMLCDTYVVYKNMMYGPALYQKAAFEEPLPQTSGRETDTIDNIKQPETGKILGERQTVMGPPVYHAAPAFSLTESHPVQAETKIQVTASENSPVTASALEQSSELPVKNESE